MKSSWLWRWSMWDWAFGNPGLPDSIRALMNRNGDQAKPIIVSEYDLGPVPKYTESAEATLIAHALTDPRPAMIAAYTMLDDDVVGYGMLRPDRTRRPAWSAYQAIASSSP